MGAVFEGQSGGRSGAIAEYVGAGADPGSSPAGITDKLIIDATTPVAPDNRGHYSQPVCDLPETKARAEKLTAMLANRK